MIFRRDLAKIIGRNIMFASTGKEKQLLRKWMSHSEKHETGYNTIKRLIKPIEKSSQEDQGMVPYDEFFNRSRLLKLDKKAFGWWQVAASVAVLVALASLLMQFGFLGRGHRVELMTEAGHRLEAVLPDGTYVWLNNSSRLVYQQRFGRIRAVELEGEAYFTVFKDKTSPFIVDVDGLKIRATGTQFNVRNFSDEPVIETTLVEGGVRLKTPLGLKSKIVPGETMGFERSTGRFIRRKVNVSDNVVWKDGILVFHDSSFSNLMTRLERWYGVRIVYDAAAFDGIHYSGSIRNLRIDQVFDFINLTIPIEVKMKEDYILLSKIDEAQKE